MPTLRELSEKFESAFSGNGDLLITHACGLDSLRPGGIAYITDPQGMTSVPTPVGMARKALTSVENISANDAAIVVPKEVNSSIHNLIFAEDPLDLHVQITQYLHAPLLPEQAIHPTAVIGKQVTLAEGVSLGPHVVLFDHIYIGKNSQVHAGVIIMSNTTIGAECLLYPNVVIREGSQIGNRVIIQPNAVIGSDGHGYYQRQGLNKKIPQVGRVIIEDDVEIGACTTIDRARFSETIIRKGSKLDNQVQIAHNVEIGAQALISAQTAIGGSTKTGHHLILGGQTGIVDHMEVGNHVTAVARAVITAKAQDHAVLGGMPSRPVEQWRQIQALLGGLDNLFKRVLKLEKRLPPA